MANNDTSILEDPERVNHWNSLALRHWSKATRAKKVDPEVVRNEIWDVLQSNNFDFRSLLALDNLQLLEKYVPLKLFAGERLYASDTYGPDLMMSRLIITSS